MRKILFLAILVFGSSLLAASANAQAKRIHFKRGATSAIVTGRLNGAKDQRAYVIRVRKGQVLSTGNVGDHHITVAIEPPRGTEFEDDLAADCHDKHEVNPTTAGDYKIYVTECLKADPFKGKFKLMVTVE
jgi:hypothetical protein